MTSYTLPSIYEVVKPDFFAPFDHHHHQHPNHSHLHHQHNQQQHQHQDPQHIAGSAFHRVGSPPELLHDSEEDDGDSLSTSPSLQQHDLYDDHPRRKSMPHRSPSVIQDAFQASALDKSVVFQWSVNQHSTSSSSMLPSTQTQQQRLDQTEKENKHNTMEQPQVQSKVICGESLISALRHRVALARQQDLPIKKRNIHMPRRQLTATCIALPTHHKQHITKHKMSIPVLTSPTLSPKSSSSPQPASSSSSSSSPSSVIVPPSSPPSEPSYSYAPSSSSPSLSSSTTVAEVIPLSLPSKQASSPSSSSLPSPPMTAISSTPVSQPKQRGRKPLQHPRHTSSGRPSRVKGPCQACQETSDGCMRKAFDWPFPASQIFNDKGKPFVYLCNKCGLRYNKSGGCVCRHCRWVFCKEEKRKAMQYIDKMRRNRPNGYVDPDEDIENFVCSPKYWSCGRPWKVGWVLNNNNLVDSDSDDHDPSASPLL